MKLTSGNELLNLSDNSSVSSFVFLEFFHTYTSSLLLGLSLIILEITLLYSSTIVSVESLRFTFVLTKLTLLSINDNRLGYLLSIVVHIDDSLVSKSPVPSNT